MKICINGQAMVVCKRLRPRFVGVLRTTTGDGGGGLL